MKNAVHGLLLIATTSLSGNALAGPLNDYNLILRGDLNHFSGGAQGAVFLGGNLNASGNSPTFGGAPFANPNALTVAGNINANNLNINSNKNLVYGGALNVRNVNGNGTKSHVPGISVAPLFDQLQQEADAWAQLEANGSFSKGVLSYGGSDALAVFNLDASELFAQNTNLKLLFGNASQVVINVSGANVAVKGGVNITAGFKSLGAANILWNFHEAQSIDFNGIGMYGAVLALGADARGGSSFDGSFAARSYTGDRHFRQPGSNLQAPVQKAPIQEPVSVPEPATAFLLLGGLLGLFAAVRRRFCR